MTRALNPAERLTWHSPLRTIFSKGEAFEATLGVINLLDENTNFFIEIIQVSGPEEGPLFIYRKETGSLSPGDSTLIDIGVNTYPDTPEGIYSYSILVCKEVSCAPGSPEQYSTREMAFRIS